MLYTRGFGATRTKWTANSGGLKKSKADKTTGDLGALKAKNAQICA
jgi:hypothetical protein